MLCLRMVSWLLVGAACGLTAVAAEQPQGWTAASITVRNGVLRVEANEAMSLHGVLIELEHACGCPITFEYPPLEHPDDMIDTSSSPAKGRLRSLTPRGGAFGFSYPLRGPSVRDDIDDIVREAVRAYEARGLPGRFTVEREGAMLHVVPVSVRSAANGWRPVTSILDTAITVPEREASAMDAIRAVLDAVHEASGVTVKLTAQPIDLLMRHQMRIAANNEPAHVVLVRLLESLPAPMSWTVAYNLLAKDYTVGIYLVWAK